MNKILQKLANRIKTVLTKQCPNTHMKSTTAKLYSLDEDYSFYSRPSFSDSARRSEYESCIYAPNNLLTKVVHDKNPIILIDIGANIGLSSLSLHKMFPSIRLIIGIEAEKENFGVLRLNYEHWQSKQTESRNDIVKFTPIYAIASNICEKNVSNVIPTRLEGGVSASGTFKFITHDSSKQAMSTEDGLKIEDPTEFSREKISIDEIFKSYINGSSEGVAVVKVDIEGGEEELFQGPCEWLNRTAFLTVEIHDSMGSPFSSRHLVQKLYEYDFALLPENDVLHCYNRKLLDLR